MQRFCFLFCAEQPVACISHSRKNVTVFVKASVYVRDVYLHVRVFLFDFLDTDRRAEYRHEFDFFASFFLQNAYRLAGRAACGKHRVKKYAGFFRYVFRKFAVVFLRFQRVVIAI